MGGRNIAPLSIEHSRLFLGAGLVPLTEGGFGDGMRFAGQPVDIADDALRLASAFPPPNFTGEFSSTTSARNSSS